MHHATRPKLTVSGIRAIKFSVMIACPMDFTSKDEHLVSYHQKIQQTIMLFSAFIKLSIEIYIGNEGARVVYKFDQKNFISLG